MIKSRQQVFTAIVAAVLIFAGGYGLGRQNFQAGLSGGKITFSHETPSPDQKIDFQLFWDTLSALKKDYYDQSKIDGQKVLYGAIEGMVGSLGDPFTSFLTPDQNKAFQGDLSGTYEGVGIELGYKDGKMVVVAPLDGTPAKSSGIKAGDRILKIAGKVTDSLTLPDAVIAIRGKAGSTVEMTFQRGSTDPFTVTLTRAQIQVKSVEFTDKGSGVGYIRLTRFAENTNVEWDTATSQAAAAGSRVIVLDLRDNPGGLLDSAVYVASEFLSSGVVVTEQTASQKQDFKVERAGKLTKIPVVVVINKGSASAAEILAGALQDVGRGTLVGEQSFGKGTVQLPIDIDCPDQSTPSNCSSLHVTVAKWLTPNGRWIHGTGLTPDIPTGLTDDDFKAGRDPQLDRALSTAKAEIH